MRIDQIEQIINALIELVKAIDDSRNTTIPLKQANKYIKEYITVQGDLDVALEKLLNMRDRGELNDILYQKILRLLLDLRKQNKSFANGLNYIVNKII